MALCRTFSFGGLAWAMRPAGLRAALCGALWAFAAPALAQPNLSERTRGADARTTVGAPAAQRCAAAAAAGAHDADSLKACDEALTIESLNRANRIVTLINRGAMHLRAGRGDLALADFDAVVALDRRNAEAHLNRGAALVMVRRPGPAVAAITEALGLGVREPHKAYLNRGAAREALGDLRGAYEDYATALEIQPDWGPAGQELARFARVRRDRLRETLAEPAEAPAPPPEAPASPAGAGAVGAGAPSTALSPAAAGIAR